MQPCLPFGFDMLVVFDSEMGPCLERAASSRREDIHCGGGIWKFAK